MNNDADEEPSQESGEEPIDEFERHMLALNMLLEYLALIPVTVIPLVKLLNDEQRREIQQMTDIWIDFNRRLFESPSLYAEPNGKKFVPRGCMNLADFVVANRGVLPSFDFMYSPISKPLGNWLSFLSVAHCWDAFDTYFKRVFPRILEQNPSHPNVEKYRKLLQESKKEPTTTKKLETLGIAVTDEQIAKTATEIARDAPSTGRVKQIRDLAKLLRSSYVHHFGKPTSKLIDYLKVHKFDSVVMRDGELQIFGPAVGEIATYIQAEVVAIERAKRIVFGG